MMLQRTGLAQAFVIDDNSAFQGNYLIEHTLLPDNYGAIQMIFDHQPQNNGYVACKLPFNNTTVGQTLATNRVELIQPTCRFTYPFQDGRGSTYLLGNDNPNAGGNTFLWKSQSPDMTSWSKVNNGYAVLYSSTLSDISNVAAKPVGDVLHALIEVPNGLYYSKSQAPALGDINFSTELSSELVIPGGGNADLDVSPCGQYLVALHGMRATNRFQVGTQDLYWFTTASIGKLSDNLKLASNWRTVWDAFVIGQNNYSVCDPSWCDDGLGGTVGLLSYNQQVSVRWRIPMSKAQLMKYLIGI